MRQDPRSVVIDISPDGNVAPPPSPLLFSRGVAYALFGLSLAGFALTLAFFLSVAIAFLPVILAFGLGVFFLRSLNRRPTVPPFH